MPEMEVSVFSFPPRKIMAPVDGSENSRRAAVVAIRLAKDYSAELILEHAMPMPMMLMASPVDVGPTVDYQEYYGVMESEAKKWIAPLAIEAENEGLKCNVDVVRGSGSIVETIIRRADDGKVELIVIGTRGLGGFKKLLIGSVSSGVVAGAHCSVLVVR